MQPGALGDPFTRSSARAAGLTDHVLGREVRLDGLARLRRGVYSTSIEPGPRQAALAASLAYPGLPLSLLSSAVLQAIPVVGVRPRAPEMTVAPRGAGNIRGVHAYRARLREHEVTVVDGHPCTTPARTAVDIARHYPLVTAVCALDHVLHAKLATPAELRDVVDFCRRWPGAPRARRALQLCDSRAESPLESVSRLVIPRLGFPAPEPQVIIVDSAGVVIARTDFYWDEFGVAGEADGRGKYDRRDVLIDEKRREKALHDAALELARWYWRQAWSDPADFRRELADAFARAAERSRAGLPRRWTAVSTPRLRVL